MKILIRDDPVHDVEYVTLAEAITEINAWKDCATEARRTLTESQKYANLMDRLKHAETLAKAEDNSRRSAAACFALPDASYTESLAESNNLKSSMKIETQKYQLRSFVDVRSEEAGTPPTYRGIVVGAWIRPADGKIDYYIQDESGYRNDVYTEEWLSPANDKAQAPT